MKKIIAMIITLVTMTTLATLVVNAKNETEYPKTFVVTRVTENTVFCVDFNGLEWAFNTDTEDWFVGDFVSAIMNNNGTENIYDDYFVCVKYAGWLNGSWGYDYETSNPIISMTDDF